MQQLNDGSFKGPMRGRCRLGGNSSAVSGTAAFEKSANPRGVGHATRAAWLMKSRMNLRVNVGSQSGTSAAAAPLRARIEAVLSRQQVARRGNQPSTCRRRKDHNARQKSWPTRPTAPRSPGVIGDGSFMDGIKATVDFTSHRDDARTHHRASSARFSSSTFTRGSPKTPKSLFLVFCCTIRRS
jgi:hypothetical protein